MSRRRDGKAVTFSTLAVSDAEVQINLEQGTLGALIAGRCEKAADEMLEQLLQSAVLTKTQVMGVQDELRLPSSRARKGE